MRKITWQESLVLFEDVLAPFSTDSMSSAALSIITYAKLLHKPRILNKNGQDQTIRREKAHILYLRTHKP